MTDKPLVWCGSSREDVRAFPALARRRAGFELRGVQQGDDPSDWKPMKSVGAGVREIRIRVEGEHRVIYVAKFEEAVYVLHAFEKKTPKTRKQDVELARKRLQEVLGKRRRP